MLDVRARLAEKSDCAETSSSDDDDNAMTPRRRRAFLVLEKTVREIEEEVDLLCDVVSRRKTDDDDELRTAGNRNHAQALSGGGDVLLEDTKKALEEFVDEFTKDLFVSGSSARSISDRRKTQTRGHLSAPSVDDVQARGAQHEAQSELDGLVDDIRSFEVWLSDLDDPQHESARSDRDSCSIGAGSISEERQRSSTLRAFLSDVRARGRDLLDIVNDSEAIASGGRATEFYKLVKGFCITVRDSFGRLRVCLLPRRESSPDRGDVDCDSDLSRRDSEDFASEDFGSEDFDGRFTRKVHITRMMRRRAVQTRLAKESYGIVFPSFVSTISMPAQQEDPRAGKKGKGKGGARDRTFSDGLLVGRKGKRKGGGKWNGKGESKSAWFSRSTRAHSGGSFALWETERDDGSAPVKAPLRSEGELALGALLDPGLAGQAERIRTKRALWGAAGVEAKIAGDGDRNFTINLEKDRDVAAMSDGGSDFYSDDFSDNSSALESDQDHLGPVLPGRRRRRLGFGRQAQVPRAELPRLSVLSVDSRSRPRDVKRDAEHEHEKQREILDVLHGISAAFGRFSNQCQEFFPSSSKPDSTETETTDHGVAQCGALDSLRRLITDFEEEGFAAIMFAEHVRRSRDEADEKELARLADKIVRGVKCLKSNPGTTSGGS